MHGDYVYLIERDNQVGAKAALKKIFRVAIAELKGAEIGTELPVVKKEEVRDLIPDLARQERLCGRKGRELRHRRRRHRLRHHRQ